MKNKYLVVAILLSMALGISCEDKSTYPIDFDQLNNSNGGILKQVEQTSVTFDKTDMAGSYYEVLLEANDRDRGKLFTQMEVFVSFVDRTPGNGNSTKAEKLVQTYQASEFTDDPVTGLPRITVTHTAPAVMTLLGLTAPDVDGTDQFVFRQAMHFPDGRIFTSTNVGNAVATVPVFSSPFANTVAVICPSDLGGPVNFSTIVTAAVVPIAPCLPPNPPVQGVTQFTATSTPGKYAVADATFGQYDCAWNDNPAAGTFLNDACLLLEITGADQYGLVYDWVIVGITPDGVTMTIDWTNDYGDAGTTQLSRTGKTWPLGLHF